jgi:hypothetical protein
VPRPKQTDVRDSVVRLDPGGRWRLFAVAACGCRVKSQQEVPLYAARLRARRAGNSTERRLPTAAQFDRKIVDHASVAGSLARDADRIS